MSNSIDFSHNGAFDPVAIKAMEEAFELACVTLKKRQQADEERLARLIIQAVKDGLRDPGKLSARAVNNITAPM